MVAQRDNPSNYAVWYCVSFMLPHFRYDRSLQAIFILSPNVTSTGITQWLILSIYLFMMRRWASTSHLRVYDPTREHWLQRSQMNIRASNQPRCNLIFVNGCLGSLLSANWRGRTSQHLLKTIILFVAYSCYAPSVPMIYVSFENSEIYNAHHSIIITLHTV